jgi:hypothetical protein
MARKKAGARHALLLYQRFWGRLWRATFLFGMLLFILWLIGEYLELELLGPRAGTWLLLGALASFLVTLIALVARRVSFVQARPDYLRVMTPFFPLRISYRRIVSNRVGSLAQFFPPAETRGAARRYIEPFYGQSLVVVEMKGTPLPPWAMRMFLSRYMYADLPPRLVFIVADWMRLSTEIDSALSAWRDRQAYQRHRKDRGRR